MAPVLQAKAVVDKKQRMFQRRNVFAALAALPLADTAKTALLGARREQRTESAGSFDRLWRQALTQIAPACVVISSCRRASEPSKFSRRTLPPLFDWTFLRALRTIVP